MMTKRDFINELSRQCDQSTSAKLDNEEVMRDVRRDMEHVHAHVRTEDATACSKYVGHALVDLMTVAHRLGVDVGEAFTAELEIRLGLRRRGHNA